MINGDSKILQLFPLQSFWSIQSTAQSTDVIHEPTGLTNSRINKRIHGTAWKKIINVVFRKEKIYRWYSPFTFALKGTLKWVLLTNYFFSYQKTKCKCVYVDKRNMRGAPKLKMCLKWQTKLGRFTVSFLLLHICEEKDGNEDFDFKLLLKSNKKEMVLYFTFIHYLVLVIHRYIF